MLRQHVQKWIDEAKKQEYLENTESINWNTNPENSVSKEPVLENNNTEE